MPLFAVGIIIGLPGNPGRTARWLVRFRVRRWKPTTVQKEERRERGRRWQKGESGDLHGRGERDETRRGRDRRRGAEKDEGGGERERELVSGYG